MNRLGFVLSNPKNRKNEKEEKRKQINKRTKTAIKNRRKDKYVQGEREREGGRGGGGGGGGGGFKDRGAKRLVFHRITVVTLLRNAFFFSFSLSLWVCAAEKEGKSWAK